VTGLVERHRPHRLERLEVSRNRAARGEIAARLRQAGGAAAREQRSEEQDGTAQLADEQRVGPIRGNRRAPDLQRRRSDTVDGGAKAPHQLDQHLDVPDARDVLEHALLVRQQACRQQRQRGILVPFDGHLARQPPAAFDA
jgi:hypothetical protein